MEALRAHVGCRDFVIPFGISREGLGPKKSVNCNA